MAESKESETRENPEDLLASKDVNENLEGLTHQQKVEYIENEVQTLLQFCISKGISEKELSSCVSAFTGETSSAAKRFYKTNQRFLTGVAFVALAAAIVFGWEPVYMRVCVHARLLSMKILPYWDWTVIFNQECFIVNPYLPVKNFTEQDCLPCVELSKNGIEHVRNISKEVIAKDFLFVDMPAVIDDGTKGWPGLKELTLPNLAKMYRTHKDLEDLGNCTFFSTNPEHTNLYEFLDDYEEKKLPNEPWHVFWENCQSTAAKAIRRLFRRPYFLPLSTEMSAFNNIHVAKGVSEGDQTEEPLINQDDASGTWLGVVSGEITVQLEPREPCVRFGCKPIEFKVGRGQAMLVGHNLYTFNYSPTFRGITVAVSSSISFDE